MKIGLFFGSFNPIHIGHLIIAQHFADWTDLDQVWLIVSPQNPFKEKSGLLDEKHRLYMANIAVETMTGSGHPMWSFIFPTQLYH